MLRPHRRYLALIAVGPAVAAAAACTAANEPPPAQVRALELARAPTPRFPVPRYETSGTYPRVAGDLDLRAVNAAVRSAVIADQREYAPYARKERPKIPRDSIYYSTPGAYHTAVDRALASASTVVVSALMPAKRELFPGQKGGDGWLGVTVDVPSGRRVRITDLFADRAEGLRMLAREWKRRAARCVRFYHGAYAAAAQTYRQFALTPQGLAVGSSEAGACYRMVTIVPYRVLAPHLNALGRRLVAGVRAPR